MNKRINKRTQQTSLRKNEELSKETEAGAKEGRTNKRRNIRSKELKTNELNERMRNKGKRDEGKKGRKMKETRIYKIYTDRNKNSTYKHYQSNGEMVGETLNKVI